MSWSKIFEICMLVSVTGYTYSTQHELWLLLIFLTNHRTWHDFRKNNTLHLFSYREEYDVGEKIKFSVFAEVPASEHVFVVGNLPCLGNWNPEYALKLDLTSTVERFNTIIIIYTTKLCNAQSRFLHFSDHLWSKEVDSNLTEGSVVEYRFFKGQQAVKNGKPCIIISDWETHALPRKWVAKSKVQFSLNMRYYDGLYLVYCGEYC